MRMYSLQSLFCLPSLSTVSLLFLQKIEKYLLNAYQWRLIEMIESRIHYIFVKSKLGNENYEMFETAAWSEFSILRRNRLSILGHPISDFPNERELDSLRFSSYSQ